MPYICLSRNDIPDGILQVLDLRPNTSQRNANDAPGQTRYLNRVSNNPIPLITTAGVTTTAAGVTGLAAYLADKVAPGGTQAAADTLQAQTLVVGDSFTLGGVTFTAVENTCLGDITSATAVAGVGALTLGGVAFDCVEDYATGTIQVLVGVAAGDTVTIAGVTFTAINGVPNPAAQEFQDVAGSGSAINTAASLVTAINDGATQTLLTAALDALVAVPTGGTLTGANGGTDTVTLTPSVAGDWGDATLAESTAGVDFTLSGAAMTHTDASAAGQEFNSAAHFEGTANPDNGVAVSLAATINDAASIILIDAANGGPAPGVLNGHFVATVDAVVTEQVNLESSQVGVGGELTLVSAQPATLVLSGATLVHTQPDATSQEFSSLLDAGTDILVAGTIDTVLNNAATDAALLASATGGSTVTSASGGTDTATITADTTGPVGTMPLVVSDPVTMVLGTATGHLNRTHEEWTRAQVTGAADALITRLDAGLALTEGDINTAVNGIAGVSGCDVSHASGSSSVMEILSILAGRGYTVPAGQFASAEGRWESALSPLGAFVDTVSVFDTQMVGGEIRPANPFVKQKNTSTFSNTNNVTGGSTQSREYKPIRHTVDGEWFDQSLLTGNMLQMQDGSAVLFPDNSDFSAFHASSYYGYGTKTDQVDSARLVTVYNDDGTLA